MNALRAHTLRLSGLLLGAAAFLLSACVKQQEDAGEAPLQAPLSIRLSLPAAGDIPLRDLQLMVFDRRGDAWRDCYYHTGDLGVAAPDHETEIILPDGCEVPAGDKRVVAVLNGPDCSSFDNFAEWQEASYLLGGCDHPDADILLYGQADLRLGTESVCLQTGRMVGRVVVRSIRNELDGGHAIDSLYLFIANAAGAVRFGEACSTDAVLLNPEGHAGTFERGDDSYLLAPLVDGSAGQTAAAWTCARAPGIDSGEESAASLSLYSCPTPSADQAWLVVAASVLGRVWYYSIPLDPFRKDRSQEFSLVLRALGTDTPCIANNPGDYSLENLGDNWQIITSNKTI